MSVWIAECDTGHFQWIALAETEEEARRAWLDGFKRHIMSGPDKPPSWREYLKYILRDPDPVEYFGVRLHQIAVGECLRDGSPV